MNARPTSRGRAAGPAGGADARAVVFRAAALLLDYPASDAAAAEADARLVSEAVDDLPASPARRRLRSFLAAWLDLRPAEREALFVETFDLAPQHSLHLGFWRGGDAGRRAAFLLRLRSAYRASGLDVSAAELPDYLPLLLEYAAVAPGGARVLAAEAGALERLRASLASAGSSFELVVSAVLAALPAVAAAERSGR